jgi:two-component system nitrate/nitrite response regulator NarL
MAMIMRARGARRIIPMGSRNRGIEDAARGHQHPRVPVHVLVVDDNPEFRAIASELLHARGFIVVGEASSGRTAREAVRRLAPQAVLLDVRLGLESGLELARDLTWAHGGLIVVLTSAGDARFTLEEILACGARAFVPKTGLVNVDLVTLLTPLGASPAR